MSKYQNQCSYKITIKMGNCAIPQFRTTLFQIPCMIVTEWDPAEYQQRSSKQLNRHFLHVLSILLPDAALPSQVNGFWVKTQAQFKKEHNITQSHTYCSTAYLPHNLTKNIMFLLLESCPLSNIGNNSQSQTHNTGNVLLSHVLLVRNNT